MRLNYWLFLLFTVLMLASLSHAVTQCPLKGCDCGKICTRTFDCVHGQHKKHKRVDTRLFIPSKESLKAQNAWVDEMGLQRYNDKRDLTAAIKAGDLVFVGNTETLRVNIPRDRQYCRPWVLTFLNDFSAGYAKEFHSPLLLDSAVRTRQVQGWLRRHNRNAAPIHGETESSHMAGATIDIARHSMNREQTQWVEQYLWALDVQNKVIVEEEKACFHIMVHRRIQ